MKNLWYKLMVFSSIFSAGAFWGNYEATFNRTTWYWAVMTFGFTFEVFTLNVIDKVEASLVKKDEK